MPLRLVFMGTPEFSVPVLSEIIGAGHEVVAVYTRAPRAAGRGLAERKSPVHRLAEGFGIPVFTPASLKGEEAVETLENLGADAAVVVAYGMLLPQAVLDVFPLGCFNVHASLLPRWRGAAPINRAIMAGDTETCVAIMRMEAGLDTGPVAMVERIAIGPDDTAGEVHDRLSRLGADLMHRALGALERGALTLTPQENEGVTYAAKLTNAETRIDWSLPAGAVHNHIRGLSPHPSAWCLITVNGKDERLKILRSHALHAAEWRDVPLLNLEAGIVPCGTGAVQLHTVQRAGGKPMPWADFIRGARGLERIT